MYLSKLQIVFVQPAKFICQTCWMYLSYELGLGKSCCGTPDDRSVCSPAIDLIDCCALLMNFNSKALMQIVSKYSTYATTKKVLEPLRGKRPEFYKWIERFTNRKMKKKKLSNHRNDTICQNYLKLPNRYICRYLNITIKDRPEAPLMLNTPEVPWKKTIKNCWLWARVTIQNFNSYHSYM